MRRPTPFSLACALILSASLAAAAIATTPAAPAPQPAAWQDLASATGNDGLGLRLARTAPVVPGTAAPAVSPPAGYQLWLGPVWASSSNRWVVVYRQLPAAPPSPGTPVAQPATKPATQPAKAALSPTTQPHRTAYPNGIYSVGHTADQVVRDAYVKGQARNIVCQAFAGNLLIDNVVSVDAMGPAQYDGQGFYGDDLRGTTRVTNSYFGYNGRSRLPGAWSPTQYAHHIYHNNTTGKSGRLVVTGCVFAGSAADAIEARSLAGSEVAGNVFLDDGMALCVIMGGADFHDNLVYGGAFWWDGGGWTGNTALKAYWPVVCRNNVVLSRPHQGDVPQSTAHPATKAWPQYGINLGGSWSHADPPWTPPPGYPVPLYMSGSGNLISPSWPGGVWYSSGKLEQGAGAKLQGWGLTKDGPDFDYAGILADVEAERVSVPDAITKLRAALLPADPSPSGG